MLTIQYYLRVSNNKNTDELLYQIMFPSNMYYISQKNHYIYKHLLFSSIHTYNNFISLVLEEFFVLNPVIPQDYHFCTINAHTHIHAMT